MEPKRLYRSRNRVIGGVAAGLADYFQIDVVITRILFIALLLFGGGGFIIYLILWIVLPEEPVERGDFEFHSPKPPETEYSSQSEPQMNEPAPRRSGRHDHDDESKTKGAIIAGVILITLGALFFIDNLVPNINFGDLWPIFLIVLGLVILVTGLPGIQRRNNSKNDES